MTMNFNGFISGKCAKDHGDNVEACSVGALTRIGILLTIYQCVNTLIIRLNMLV